MPPCPAKVVAPYPYPFPAIALLGMLAPGAGPHELARVIGHAAADGFADDRPALVYELAKQMLHRITPWQMAIAQSRAMSSWHGPARLERVQVPTVIVQGARDRLVPAENALRLLQLLPHADYVELPDVGHLVFHEAGEELLELLGCDAPPSVKARAA